MASKTTTPIKHVLLQQERVFTHDRTWLPARLQPPTQGPDKPYSVYLADYETYLLALQHMKSIFLGTRRANQALRTPVHTGRTTVRWETGDGPRPREIVSPAIVFGTAPVVRESFPRGANLVSQSSTARAEPIVPLVSAPTVTPTPISANKLAARRRARNQRRKAARRAKAKSPLEQLQATAAEVEARASLVKAHTVLVKAKRTKGRLQKRSPSYLRRKERRRAARASQPPAPTTHGGSPAPTGD